MTVGWGIDNEPHGLKPILYFVSLLAKRRLADYDKTDVSA
jgi:hypothetical protein